MNYKNPINILELSQSINDKIDLFICSASFEERCLKIPEQISKLKPLKVVICHNKNHSDSNQRNLEKINSYFENSINLDFISNDPLSNAVTFLRFLDNLVLYDNFNIYIDITTFTHETLLILFRYLHMRMKNCNIFYIYIDAIDYSINEEDPSKKWLSKGIGEIRSVLGYPGIISPAKKNHLIIIFGFESERTQKLIETYESHIVSLAFGPVALSTHKKHYELNYERHKELLNYYPDSSSFEVSMIDPIEAKKDILKQINKFPDMNVIIAPMSTKVSTIGTALLALENTNVQLTYVTANQYNIHGYSKAGENCYLFLL